MNPLVDKTIQLFNTYRPKTRKQWFVALGWVGVVFIVIILLQLVYPIYVIATFEQRKVPQSTKIYDRTGEVLLYDMHGDVKRTEVPLSEIPQDLKDAVISIEDHSFYEHDGISARGIIRALVADVKQMSFAQGGSTITQQVVKNSLLTDSKTPLRKFKEILLALLLERKQSKDQILETYLNESSYGGVLYGVEEASLTFFGKQVNDLTLAESAYIAALPKAPSYYSPYGENRENLNYRKDLVLEKMLEYGYITQEELNSAKAEKVAFIPKKNAGIRAPHFVFYVKQYLIDKYGEEAVERGGLNIVTSLDWDLQLRAEATVTRVGASNAKTFNATNAGLVAMDPKTGQILAMVGSRDYFSTDIEGMYNVTTAARQPGSAFKPFVYATAFAKGYTPDTIVFDLKTQFSTTCAIDNFTIGSGCYAPQNYDGAEHGPISMRNALGNSLNIASVKVLYLAGIQDSITTAQRAGITTLTPDGDYGLSLVLGGGAVTLLDMTSAYGVFANDGAKNEKTPIVTITDSKGKLIETYQPKPEQVMDSDVAQLMSSVLSDNDARLLTFRPDSPLNMGSRVAVKTGTSNDYRDVWTIGYSDGIVIGAWAGNNDNSAMKQAISAYIIAPIWRDVMSYAVNRYPTKDYQRLESVLTGNETPMLSGQFDIDGQIHDILHWISKNDPRGGQPSNPAADPQYTRWEYSVKKWASTYVRPIEIPTDCWNPFGPEGFPNPYYNPECIAPLPEQATTTDIFYYDNLVPEEYEPDYVPENYQPYNQYQPI